MSDIILKTKVQVNEKPKSSAKLWKMVESYPVVLELSFNLSNATRGYTNSVRVTNLANNRSWGDSALNIKRLLSDTNNTILG